MNKKIGKIKKYLMSCFLLILPIVVWNIFLADDLPRNFQPEIFSNRISLFLTMGEQISRTIIFVLTLVMPLSITSKIQKMGIVIYVTGTLIYFASWLVLIYYPQGRWSNSYLGFLSPSCTPIFWLTGIALAGSKFYFNFPYKRWMFIAFSVVFLIFHNIHTSIIYNRIQRNKKNIMSSMHLKSIVRSTKPGVFV